MKRERYPKGVESIGNESITIITLLLVVLLVSYMAVVVATNCVALIHFLIEVPHMFRADAGEAMHMLGDVGPEFLHGIAIFVVLIKAYKVLMSYAKHHHVGLKYIAEIAIVAGVLEILFNIKSYSIEQISVIALFSLGVFFLYIWKYDVFQNMNLENHKQM